MFESFIENKKIGGINCLVWKNGQTLYQRSFGYKDLESGELMTIDSLFRISSMTKPVTSVLAMMLYEEKKLDLNDAIIRWFPQFESMKVFNQQSGAYEDAKEAITILDILTHKAGFTYSEFLRGELRDDYRKLGGDIDTWLTQEQWINELANLPLISQPNELFNYGRSTDLLGILISRIEGKSLGQIMEERIFAPLGMHDTFFEVPANKKERCVTNFGFDYLGNLVCVDTVPLNMAFKERPQNLEYESGGQGLWSSISDYLKFAKIFIEKGCSDGIRILNEETVELMCTNKLTAY